jgi:hypothetical protein
MIFNNELCCLVGQDQPNLDKRDVPLVLAEGRNAIECYLGSRLAKSIPKNLLTSLAQLCDL